MQNRGRLNRLKRDGVSFRELQGQRGSGFVIRVFNPEVRPALITTVVMQPGHENVNVQTIEATIPAYSGRIHGGEPTQPESIDNIVNRLERRAHAQPVARMALNRLVEVIE